MLVGGAACLGVGLATRDPATTGIGVTLLVATPAAAGVKKDDPGSSA